MSTARLRVRSFAMVVACALPLAGCAQPATPEATAERITRSVYANDFDAATATFDDDTKKTITRTNLGQLSDRMHALGDFQSLAAKSADADKGRYEFDAHFAKGAMLVMLRIDPSGKVGAYRVTPE